MGTEWPYSRTYMFQHAVLLSAYAIFSAESFYLVTPWNYPQQWKKSVSYEKLSRLACPELSF